MARNVIAYRFVINLALAAIVGGAGLALWPFPVDHPLLALIETQQPTIYAAIAYGYATVWFTTPFLIINVASAFLYIFVARTERGVRRAPLPPTRCYLKPYYLNPQISYFDAVATGAV